MNIDDLISNFNMIDNWDDKYSYLLDLGKELPPFEIKDKIDENKIYGCSASVWWKFKIVDDKYFFYFDSDALIVKGILYIISLLFNGLDKNQIKNIDAFSIFNKLGLSSHLSNQRQAGISSIINKIQNF